MTGESVTGAITVAVRERLDRLVQGSEGAVASRAARLRDIARDAAGRWPTAPPAGSSAGPPSPYAESGPA